MNDSGTVDYQICWSCEKRTERGAFIQIKQVDDWPHLGYINLKGVFINTYDKSALPEVETFVCEKCYNDWREKNRRIGVEIPPLESLRLTTLREERIRKMVKEIIEESRERDQEFSKDVAEEIVSFIIKFIEKKLFQAISKRQKRRILKRLGLPKGFLNSQSSRGSKREDAAG